MKTEQKPIIKIINKSTNQLPTYKTMQSSGMDVRAFMENNVQVTLQPMERALIHTGLYVELPEDMEIQVRPRSGLALTEGITVLNTPGTIDADYRGEIIVALIDDSATVKRFYKENGHIRLQPENDFMDPIIVDDCMILGKVIGLMRWDIS